MLEIIESPSDLESPSHLESPPPHGLTMALRFLFFFGLFFDSMISSIYNDGGYKVKPKKVKNAKNRVQNGSEQRPQDAFYTPLAVFEAIKMLILEEFKYSNVLYDPVCGKEGAKEAFPFFKWILHDKFPCEEATTKQSIDFEFSEVTKFDCLITNPPFSRIYPFVKKAYKLGKPFCLLLPNYVIYKRGVVSPSWST